MRLWTRSGRKKSGRSGTLVLEELVVSQKFCRLWSGPSGGGVVAERTKGAWRVSRGLGLVDGGVFGPSYSFVLGVVGRGRGLGLGFGGRIYLVRLYTPVIHYELRTGGSTGESEDAVPSSEAGSCRVSRFPRPARPTDCWANNAFSYYPIEPGQQPEAVNRQLGIEQTMPEALSSRADP